MLLLVGLIGLLSAQECQAPPEQDGLMFYCADGMCISICNDDLMVPLGGLSQFTCADYPNGDYPFPTSCGHPCQEPASGPNLNQQCTDTHCTYSCQNDQFLTGPVTIYCNHNGEWGSQPPVCSSEKQYCPEIHSPLVGQCTDTIEYGSICDYSCKNGYELVGAQNAECIYNSGSYQWSSALPSCNSLSTDIPDNIATESTEKPTTIKDKEEEETPVDCSDGRFSFSCLSKPRNQLILGGAAGGLLFVIILIVIIFCCIKKRNDRSKETPAFFDENPTLQKSVRSSHADNDHIVAPNSYTAGATMGHSVPSNSFYRGAATQRTQYQHRHEVSSPKRNVYGPYSEVQINPNRNLDEEGLPFISDPSNNDNFNDSAHYAGSSRGGLAQNSHYDYGRSNGGQQPQMSTFFS